MMRINKTSRFKKQYRLMLKRGYDSAQFETVVDTLAQGKSLDSKHRDHGLTGEWLGFRECHIEPDWLLIYLVEKDVLTLTLTQTGTHSDLFKK